MNKFRDRYFVKVDEDNARIIEGRFGKIAPYAPEKQFLGIWCIQYDHSQEKIYFKAPKPFSPRGLSRL
jgi:hypothetical protein